MMMQLTDWTGLSGLALVWMLAALRLSSVFRFARQRRALFLVAAWVVAMLPVSGLSLAGWLRGMTGDLSITSVLLLGMALQQRLFAPLAPQARALGRDRYTLLLFLGILALLLYPFALGLGGADPYRSGYGSYLLVFMLAMLAMWAVKRELRLLPLAVALALLAWSLGWYESTNLWDYLIDAPLALYALGVMLKLHLIQPLRGKLVRTDSQ